MTEDEIDRVERLLEDSTHASSCPCPFVSPQWKSPPFSTPLSFERSCEVAWSLEHLNDSPCSFSCLITLWNNIEYLLRWLFIRIHDLDESMYCARELYFFILFVYCVFIASLLLLDKILFTFLFFDDEFVLSDMIGCM